MSDQEDIRELRKKIDMLSGNTQINILVVGPKGSGKSALINSFIKCYTGNFDLELATSRKTTGHITTKAEFIPLTGNQKGLQNNIKFLDSVGLEDVLVDDYAEKDKDYFYYILKGLINGSLIDVEKDDIKKLKTDEIERKKGQDGHEIHFVIFVYSSPTDYQMKLFYKLHQVSSDLGRNSILICPQIDSLYKLSYTEMIDYQSKEATDNYSKGYKTLLEQAELVTGFSPMDTYPIIKVDSKMKEEDLVKRYLKLLIRCIHESNYFISQNSESNINQNLRNLQGGKIEIKSVEISNE